MNKFQLVVCDCPWTYRDKGNAGKRGASHKYKTLTVSDLCKLPVYEICADNCLLAMWWVPPMPEEALTVMRAWGFRLATMKGFTWRKVAEPDYAKQARAISRAVAGCVMEKQRISFIEKVLPTLGSKERFGLGHYTRGNTEDVLFGVRGRPKIVDHGVSQLVSAPAPRVHSQKPEEIQRRLVRLVGDVSRIELFATRPLPGWTVVGFDVDEGRDIREVLPTLNRQINK